MIDNPYGFCGRLCGNNLPCGLMASLLSAESMIPAHIYSIKTEALRRTGQKQLKRAWWITLERPCTEESQLSLTEKNINDLMQVLECWLQEKLTPEHAAQTSEWYQVPCWFLFLMVTSLDCSVWLPKWILGSYFRPCPKVRCGAWDGYVHIALLVVNVVQIYRGRTAEVIWSTSLGAVLKKR